MAQIPCDPCSLLMADDEVEVVLTQQPAEVDPGSVVMTQQPVEALPPRYLVRADGARCRLDPGRDLRVGSSKTGRNELLDVDVSEYLLGISSDHTRVMRGNGGEVSVRQGKDLYVAINGHRLGFGSSESMVVGDTLHIGSMTVGGRLAQTSFSFKLRHSGADGGVGDGGVGAVGSGDSSGGNGSGGGGSSGSCGSTSSGNSSRGGGSSSSGSSSSSCGSSSSSSNGSGSGSGSSSSGRRGSGSGSRGDQAGQNRRRRERAQERRREQRQHEELVAKGLGDMTGQERALVERLRAQAQSVLEAVDGVCADGGGGVRHLAQTAAVWERSLRKVRVDASHHAGSAAKKRKRAAVRKERGQGAHASQRRRKRQRGRRRRGGGGDGAGGRGGK